MTISERQTKTHLMLVASFYVERYNTDTVQQADAERFSSKQY